MTSMWIVQSDRISFPMLSVSMRTTVLTHLTNYSAIGGCKKCI